MLTQRPIRETFICVVQRSLYLQSVNSSVLPAVGPFVWYPAASLSPRTDVLVEDGGLSGRRTANRLRADVVCVLAKVHMLLLNISSPLSGYVGLIVKIKTGNMMSLLQI